MICVFQVGSLEEALLGGAQPLDDRRGAEAHVGGRRGTPGGAPLHAMRREGGMAGCARKDPVKHDGPQAIGVKAVLPLCAPPLCSHSWVWTDLKVGIQPQDGDLIAL